MFAPLEGWRCHVFPADSRRQEAAVDFMRQSIYESGSTRSLLGPPFMIDALASQGFLICLPGFMTGDLGFGLLPTRFRCHCLHFFQFTPICFP